MILKQRMSFEVLHPYRLQPVFPLALHGPALTCTDHTGSWDDADQCMEEESPSDQIYPVRSIHPEQINMGTPDPQGTQESLSQPPTPGVTMEVADGRQTMMEGKLMRN